MTFKISDTFLNECQKFLWLIRKVSGLEIIQWKANKNSKFQNHLIGENFVETCVMDLTERVKAQEEIASLKCCTLTCSKTYLNSDWETKVNTFSFDWTKVINEFDILLCLVCSILNDVWVTMWWFANSVWARSRTFQWGTWSTCYRSGGAVFALHYGDSLHSLKALQVCCHFHYFHLFQMSLIVMWTLKLIL